MQNYVVGHEGSQPDIAQDKLGQQKSLIVSQFYPPCAEMRGVNCNHLVAYRVVPTQYNTAHPFLVPFAMPIFWPHIAESCLFKILAVPAASSH